MYTVRITNMKQFRLAVRYILLGLSFRMASRIFEATKEEVNIGYLGNLSVMKIIGYVRVVVAVSLQTIKDLLSRMWCYLVAFDGSTYQHTSYLDIRIQV